MILEMEEIVNFFAKRDNNFSYLFYTHAIGSGMEKEFVQWEGMVGTLRNTMESNFDRIR